MKQETREQIRAEFAHLDSLYFNTAYLGPTPLCAKKKVIESLSRELNPSFYSYDNWIGNSDKLRVQLAELLNCSPDHIGHAASVSDINNTIANGMSFNQEDVVCAIDKDYPSNVLPWMLRSQHKDGPQFKLLSLGKERAVSAEWLKHNLPASTKVFCISWVAFDTGTKIDIISIGKMLREREILFVLDGTQGLGGLALTAQELELVDVFTCATYKWLLGAYGHAFAYFSSLALKKIQHTSANWVTSVNSKNVYSLLDYTTETLPGARKYDRGQTSNMLSLSCLSASLELYAQLGLSCIQNYNSKIRDHFLSNFPKNKYTLITPSEAMGNIIGLKSCAMDPVALEQQLKNHNIDVSVRQGNVRLSFHFFNTQEQVNQLLTTLDSVNSF